MKDNVAVEEPSIAWRDSDLSVSQRGEGDKTLLFIHGNSSCKEVFEALWDRPELRQFRCIGFDLPGHGASGDAEDPEASYTIPGYAAATAHVIAELGLKRPLLVGWSLGGHAALELALSQGDIAGVLITGTPPIGPGPALLQGGFTPFTFEQSTGDENATDEALTVYAGHMYGLPREEFEPFMPALLRTAGRARSRMTEHWLSHDGASHLEFAKTGKVPLAIVHGDKDPFVDAAFLDTLASNRLWGGQIHHMEQSGHASFLDAPDLFASLLSQFAIDTLKHHKGV